ncbi:ensconsin isoform X5 [Rhinoderma darwinii]|uniref:ensconsin isoform X5 n=1 Tax=Rhinoderma darwinii TaxID=43563 RepID=UPI003F66DE5E
MLIFLKSKKKKPVTGKMPGSAAATRQDRVKKSGTRPTAPSLFTINEEDEQQKNGNSKKEKAPNGPHDKVQEKKMSLSQARKDNALSKSEPHLTLKVDERQRLARERREEREKLVAARESLWLEKEVRARQHYVKHLEERKKKLEAQRLKEERRRSAVDEKRRQKLEEEKERHEAVVKRTIERSKKPKQKSNRWSWGGTLQSNTSISSSGRRPQLSPWESNVVSRLLTPTHSYLARSKSTAALSGDAASCSPISPQLSKTPVSKSSEKAKHFFSTPEAIARRRTTHFGGTSSVEKKEKRETERENVLLTPISTLKRAFSPSVPKPKSAASTSGGPPHKSSPRPIPAIVNSSIKMATTPQRPLSPGNVRPVKKDSKEVSRKKQEPNPTEIESIEQKDRPAANAEGSGQEKPRTPSPITAESTQAPPALPSTPILASPTVTNKPFAGTTDPGEATRILAEKRRLARGQREREEQEKREREEEERMKKEEIAQRQAMERARREEEAKQQEAEQKENQEKKNQEKEHQEKERLQKQVAEKEQNEREEAERLEKQKEEADRVRLEREKHFQKEEQERSDRKKRLEEIMKRTRRSETGDKQPNVQKNGEIPNLVENIAITPTPFQEEQRSVFLQSNAETPRNGESVSPSPRIVTFSQALPVGSTEKQLNENGLRTPNNNFEEIINLPVGTKPMKHDSLNNEGNSIQDLPPLNPIIAFEVDNVQTPQRAEVI